MPGSFTGENWACWLAANRSELQRISRRAAQIAEERRCYPRWWFLSFASDTAFLGAAIVRAQGILTAIERCGILGFKPKHADVQATPLTRKDMFRIPADLRNRLLNEAEVRARLDGKSAGE